MTRPAPERQLIATLSADDVVALAVRDALASAFDTAPIPGSEALAWLVDAQPDAVVVDLRGDGLQLCRSVRQTPAIMDLPICALAPPQERDIWVEAMQAGVEMVAPLPVHRAELDLRIRHLIDGVALSRAQESLVRLLAHDLRTPLTSLITSISFLEQSINCDDQRELVETCRDAVGRIRRGIDNVEMRAQVSDGAILALEPNVDVNAVLRQVGEELRSSAALREIELVFELASSPIEIAADPDVLRMTLRNALLNAVESAPAGSGVTVQSHSEPDCAVIEVVDRGGAVPDDVGADVFAARAQLRLRARRVRVGRAMSLVAVGLGVRAHGGSVALRAVGADASCLRICLPSG